MRYTPRDVTPSGRGGSGTAVSTQYVASCAVLILAFGTAAADAQSVRLRVDRREAILAGRVFGAAGPYETLVGKVEFSIDPALTANANVVDLPLAPRSSSGQVDLKRFRWQPVH